MSLTKTRKKLVSSLSILVVVAMMIVMLLPETITSAKSKEKQIEITNPITSLSEGSTYTLKAVITPADKKEKIQWKTSNKKIADVDGKGKVTAKATGKVTIAAYASTGERAACKINIVPKDGLTDSVSVLNQMLKAKKCKKITLRQLEKKYRYVIKEGDYSDRSIVFDVPKAHVENYGLFKKITINAIGEETFYEYAKGNSIDVKDNDAAIEIMNGAVAKYIKAAGSKASLELGIAGTVKELEVTGKQSKVYVYGLGALGNLTVAKGAKDSRITLEVPTTVSMSCNGSITVKAGAEGTVVEAVTGKENIDIENLSGADVILRDGKTGKETKIPGKPGVTKKLTGQVSSDGKEVIYTLPVKLDELRSMDVNVRNVSSFRLNKNVITLVSKMLDAEDQFMLLWYKLSNFKIERDGVTVKISGKADEWVKTVTLAGIKMEVKLDKDTKTVSVKRLDFNGNTYIFTKLNDTQLKITSPTSTTVGSVVSFSITY